MRSSDVPFSSRVPVASLAVMFQQARARCKRKRANAGCEKSAKPERRKRRRMTSRYRTAKGSSRSCRAIRTRRGVPESCRPAHGESARVPHLSFDRGLCKLPTSVSCGVGRALRKRTAAGDVCFRCCCVGLRISVAAFRSPVPFVRWSRRITKKISALFHKLGSIMETVYPSR